MALVNPADKEKISEEIRERYLRKYPQYKDKFFVTYCRTADGVKFV